MSEILLLFFLFKREWLDLSKHIYFCVSKIKKKKAEKQYFKEVLISTTLIYAGFYIISSYLPILWMMILDFNVRPSRIESTDM